MQRAVISLLYSTLCLVIFDCSIPKNARGQVTPDGTTSTTVNQDGNDFTVEQGDRVGDNLFHSFNEFSVPTGGSAGFNNADSIANIFSRVTGSNISSIDGLLSANGAANLFLINPNGIIFGENARLDLGGSFFASTAESLLFEGDAEFSASNSQAAPLLEVSIPIGARFRDNPGDIVNRSIVQNSQEEVIGLEVLSGKDLTLLGGNLNFEGGSLTARGGNIELGSLSQAGIVGISENGSLNFSENTVRDDIKLSNASEVDVRSSGAGNINVNARNIDLEAGERGGSRIRAGIAPDSTLPNAQAGDINIDATGNISLNNSIISNKQEGIGNSGNLIITTDSLFLRNGSSIFTATNGQGNAGLININATKNLTVDGENADSIFSGILSQVEPNGNGDSGGITISANNLSLTNGGRVASRVFGKGNSGLIDITASDRGCFKWTFRRNNYFYHQSGSDKWWDG